MLEALIVGVALGAATSSAAITMSKSKMFYYPRIFIRNRVGLLYKIVSCPYCLSHWIALALVVVYQPVFLPGNWYLAMFVSFLFVTTVAVVINGWIMTTTPFVADGGQKGQK